MQHISPRQLVDWLADTGRDAPQLLDVREDWEYELCHLEGAVLLPMHALPSRMAELDPDKDWVVICHHGMRSMQVALFLDRSGFSSVHNLSGGMDAWAAEIDPGMRRY